MEKTDREVLEELVGTLNTDPELIGSVKSLYALSKAKIYIEETKTERCEHDFYTTCIKCGIDVGEVDWSREK